MYIVKITNNRYFFFFFYQRLKWLSRLKSASKQFSPTREFYSLLPLLISSHTKPSFSEINHVKNEQSEALSWLTERGMGTINPWNICSGLIFVRITPPWKKLVVLFFFFFKNAKHVRIISKERRVRKFVESLEFFSPRVIHRSRRKWSSLLVESFYRSFPLDRLLSTDHHRPRRWKYSSCCSAKIDFIVTLHFAPLPFIYLFLGENGFLDT